MADDWGSLGGTVVSAPQASAPAPSSAPTPDDWGSLGGSVVGGPAAASGAPTRLRPLLDYMAEASNPIAGLKAVGDEWQNGPAAAGGKLWKDVQADYAASSARLKSPPKGFWDTTAQEAADYQRKAGIIGDIGGLFMSFPGMLGHAAIVRPGGAVLTALTGGDPKVNEQIVNTGLMGLGPEAGGPEAAAGAAGAEAAARSGGPGPRSGPISAALSRNAVERAAAQELARRATNVDAVRANLEGGPQEIVPGSQPTTFQQTGDIGLGELENEQRTKNRGAFAARAADQNAARVSALQGVQNGADPTAFAQSLRDRLADLDATTDAHVQTIRQGAQQHLNDMGGADTPENYGQLVRSSVQQAEDRARAWEGGLHDAVDPNHDLTVNTTETSGKAQNFLDNLPATARLKPVEQELFDTATGLDPLSPYRDFAELKSNVNEAMREELYQSGRSKTWGRLSQLNKFIQSNLANSITHQVVNESRAVEAGTLAPENTLESRLQGWVNDWKGREGGGDAGGAGQAAAGGAAGGPGADAAGLPAQGGPGGGAGGAGVPSDAAPVSPLDPDELAQLTQAAQDYARFQAGPGPKGGLFQAIKNLGGLRLRDAGGDLTPSGSEVAGAIEGGKIHPAMIKGAGLTPEAMLEALRERGWFGTNADAWEAGAGAEEQRAGWDDFIDKLQREAAGNTVFHPESGTPQRLEMQGQLKEELDRAGVQPTDKPADAITKLAKFRAAEDARAAQEVRALAQLKRRADSMGVTYRPNVDYDELLGDVMEREAIQANGATLDQHEAELDQRARFYRDHNLDQSGGGPGAEPGAAGGPEAAAAGGEAAGGTGAPGASDSGAGGGGPPAGGTGETLTPTFDEAAVARKAVADAATRLRASIFDDNANETVLRKAGNKTQYDLDPGAVAGQYFKPGATGYGTVRLLQRTIGEDAANGLLGDYAAMSLQRYRGGAIREDGTLDPGKFAAWRAQHQDALRALPPELSAKFADAASAAQAVDEASGQRALALKDAQQGALGQIMRLDDPQDIARSVGSVLNSKDASSQMRILADAAGTNPLAFEGLRQAAADHIASRLIGNTEAGTTGVAQIKADAYQQFVKDRESALSHIFSPPEIQTMKDIAADIQRSKRSETVVKNPGRSDTTGDALAQARSAAGQTILEHFLSRAAGIVPGGRIVGKGIGALAGALRQSGVDRIDQLLTEAMLNPDVAKRLLAKLPADSAPGASASLAKASNDLARTLRSANSSSSSDTQR